MCCVSCYRLPSLLIIHTTETCVIDYIIPVKFQHLVKYKNDYNEADCMKDHESLASSNRVTSNNYRPHRA